MSKKILAALLAVMMVLTIVPVTAMAAGFTDTNGHWGKDAIDRWAGVGVLNGKGDGKFDPNGSMTRAEFAQMLANMMGYTKKAANTFTDVPAGAWYEDAILKLLDAGVLKGEGNGLANPMGLITREQAAVMLCRAFGIKPSPNATLTFKDSANVSDWARDSVAALAERGMMNGIGDNTAAPQLDINRASVATLADNMIAEYVTESKTITGTVDGIILVAGDATVTISNATVENPVIVAPKAEGADVNLTGTTKADSVVVAGENASVSVGKEASAGTVTAAGASTSVKVDGKADTVSVEGSNAKVDVAGTVGTVATEAANTNVSVSGTVTNVNVAEGANSANVSTGSTAKISNVTTSAENVKVSGSGAVENVTANKGSAAVTTNGTAVKNNGTGNVTAGSKPVETGKEEVVQPGSGSSSGGSSGGGGGGSVTPSDKYRVSIGSCVGGTVTSNITSTNEANQTVTLTVTPDVQNGTTMPYVLKNLTVKNGATEVEVTDGGANTKTFAMATEGTYTVTAEFYQPITKAAVLHVNGSTTKIEDMYPYGYPTNPEGAPVDDEKLAATDGGYLFVGAVKANEELKDIALSDLVVKFNGAVKTVKWDGTNTTPFRNWGCVYINGVVEGDSSENKATDLEFEGSSAAIEVTFKFEGAEYTLTTNYTKKGVTAADIHNVTFKYGAETVTYTGTKEETVTVPTLTNTEDTYFTGKWTKEGESEAKTLSSITIGEEDATYTAESVKVENQGFAFRENGPENHGDPASSNFPYAEAYGKAGLSLEGGTIKVDGTTLKTYVENDTNSEELSHLMGAGSKATYLSVGLEYQTPSTATNATTVVCASTLDGLASSSATLDLTTGGNNVYNGKFINYFTAAFIENGEVTFLTTQQVADLSTDTDYYMWKDSQGKVLAVTKANATLQTVNQPTA